jgi:carboxyl-terminal processing protease
MKKVISIFILLMAVTELTAQQRPFMNRPANKLQMAEYAIANLYVDEVNEAQLVDSAIIKMLQQLDPHSTYSDPKEVKELTEPLQGNFDGIGVQFNMVEDTLLVIQPVSGGPSERVGVLAGDRIVSVDDITIAGVKLSTEKIMSKLRGPKGTKVNIKVLRRGADGLLDFTIRRDKIPVYSIDAAYLINKRTGYVKISRFAATTHKEFQKVLQKLQGQGMKDLILDLQGNGGGYLEAAIDVANEFLGKKDLIVYTSGRKNPRSDFRAKGDGIFHDGKLIVMIDEFSASASEIVTGALQDWDRALVVGRRSFGKGLVQRPVNLPDGSMIRLTVARYYTPSGRCIQKPYGKNLEDYNEDIIKRYSSGEMMSADSIHFPDSLKFQTLKLKRTVYGGGGIMPDYFVPMDTTMYTKYHRQISLNGILLKYHFQLIEAHRKEWASKYKKFDDFNRKFEVTDGMMKQLAEMAKKEKITPKDEEEYQKSLPQMKLQLKGLIARDLWDMSEYYQIVNESNLSVKKALELLSRKDYDKLFFMER